MPRPAKKNPQSLAEFAYDEIKKLIQTGTYNPGDKLVAQEIADRFGVSRTPVVIAVNRLAAEGYAESIPQQGTFVKPLSLKTIRDILELRLMIELYSVDSAIRNMTFDTEIVAQLRQAASEYVDIGPRDYEKVTRVESNFHYKLLELSGNQEILRVYKTSRCIETTYQMYRIADMELTTVQSAYPEHMKIVELLERQEESELKSLLEKHIRLPLNMLNWLISSGRHLDHFT